MQAVDVFQLEMARDVIVNVLAYSNFLCGFIWFDKAKQVDNSLNGTSVN